MNDDENITDEINDDINQVDDEINESDAGTSPEEEAVEFSEQQQKHLNKAAAKEAFKAREERRRADALEQEVAQLRRAATPHEERPVIPTMPDAYEDDFVQLNKNRDAAIREAALYDARAEANYNKQTQLNNQNAQKQNEELNVKINKYSQAAIKAGVSAENLRNAGQSVSDYGLDDSVTNEILTDSDGPLITMYLSSNPQEIEALNQNTGRARWNIYEAIRAKVSGKKTTGAPSPVNHISGRGVSNKRGPKGATFT